MAATLAGKPLRHIQLLRAISEESERAEASRYLDLVAHRLAHLDDVEVTTSVKHGAPVDAIHEAAAGQDLIILSTHGRGGIQRLRHGSVAERATRHLNTPTLLVRAAVAHGQQQREGD
jgi:nucleotide-binding universal stress UspA family protein